MTSLVIEISGTNLGVQGYKTIINKLNVNDHKKGENLSYPNAAKGSSRYYKKIIFAFNIYIWCNICIEIEDGASKQAKNMFL